MSKESIRVKYKNKRYLMNIEELKKLHAGELRAASERSATQLTEIFGAACAVGLGLLTVRPFMTLCALPAIFMPLLALRYENLARWIKKKLLEGAI